MDPKGKVALVTGGARIGQVVAHSLAARGCDLALVYRGSREAAEATAKAAIKARGAGRAPSGPMRPMRIRDHQRRSRKQ